MAASIDRHSAKRILLIAGETVPYSLARIPKPGETRGNLAVGGIGVFFPGTTGFASEENSSLSADFNPTKPDLSLEAEYIAFAAAGGSSGSATQLGPGGSAQPLADRRARRRLPPGLRLDRRLLSHPLQHHHRAQLGRP